MRNDEPGAFFGVTLGLAGVVGGAAWVWWAFTSGDYEGPVYFFVPSLILGGLGAIVGGWIDSGIHKIRRHLSSTTVRPMYPTTASGSASSTAPHRPDVPPTTLLPSPSGTSGASKDRVAALSRLAELLDRGLLTEEQFRQERDRLLGS